MSDIMLHGILNMPPEIWGPRGGLDETSRYQTYQEASSRIYKLEAELKKAKEQKAFDDEEIAKGDADRIQKTNRINELNAELVKAKEESAYDQRNAAMSQAESMKLLMDNAELRTAIECAMGAIRNMPCGGIGPDGATMEELSEAAKKGKALENDAVYHTAQEIYRILEAANDKRGDI